MEDTKKGNVALVEEMLRDAQKVEEPGEMAKQPVVYEGDELTPPMIAKLQSAGYSILYDTITGEPSTFNNNMLRVKLGQKRLDGSYIWSHKQLVKPTRGTLKCFLHKDDPNRMHYDTMGFAVCTYDHFNSMFHVRRHMKRKHKDEWAAIDQERIDKERAEDREFQRMLYERATEKPPLYVSKKDREQVETK